MTSLKRPAEDSSPCRNCKHPRRMISEELELDEPPHVPPYSQVLKALRSVREIWLSIANSGLENDEQQNSNREEANSTTSASSTSVLETPSQTPAPQVSVVLPDDEDAQDYGPISYDLPSKPKLPETPPTPGPSSLPSSSKSPSKTPSTSNGVRSTSSQDLTSFGQDVFGSTPRPSSTTIGTTPSSSTTPKEVFPLLGRNPRRITADSSPPKPEPLKLPSTQSSSNLPSSSRSSRAVTPLLSKHMKNARRRPRDRPHIFHDVHKARVYRDRRETHEQIRREMYEIQKKNGYSSSYIEFEGLLSYAQNLDHLLSGPKYPTLPANKLKPPSPEEEEDFLRRCLQKAKDTIEGPRPPKPYTPGLDGIKFVNRSRDAAVNKRLRPPLPSKLPGNAEREVDELLKKRGHIAKCVRENVHDTDLHRLQPREWLNDEIINFYGQMILSRSESRKEAKSNADTLLDVHYFSSFFWPKLTGDGYAKGRLAKWTKKFDLFAKDVAIFPINHGNMHWTAAAINFRKKRFEYYDSLRNKRPEPFIFKTLRDYINAEHIDKRKKPFDFSGWVDLAPEDTPRQENGWDCGVFTMHILEALSRGVEIFAFSQKDMLYLRRRMIWEIGNAQLRGGRYD